MAEKLVTHRYSKHTSLLWMAREYARTLHIAVNRYGTTLEEELINFRKYVKDEENGDEKISGTHADLMAVGHLWSTCGYPVVELSGKRAASFCATKFTEEMAGEVQLPWRAFGVKLGGAIPGLDELLVCRDLWNREAWEWSNEPQEIVSKREHEVLVMAVYRMPMDDGSFRELFIEHEEQDLSSWLKETLNVKRPEVEHRSYPFVARQKHLQLLGRVLCGVCGTLTAYHDRIAAGPPLSSTRTTKKKRKRGQKLPSMWVFRVTDPVKVDVREAVRNYVSTEGTRSSLSMQHLVTGHYKWQVYGKGRAQRKFIHVEPYWRGPEDAPIAVRPHQVV